MAGSQKSDSGIVRQLNMYIAIWNLDQWSMDNYG